MTQPTPDIRRSPYFLIALALLIVDQASKALASAMLRGHDTVVVIPGFFNLVYSRNRGGLFGYFSGMADPWRTVLLTVFPLLAVGLIAWFLGRGSETDRPTLLGLGLILGGAAGNLIDRVLRGSVVDFLDVYIAPSRLADAFVEFFGTAHWPTFNVADSGIVVGACLLLLTIFRRDE